jgi:ankyrin repeat protein
MVRPTNRSKLINSRSGCRALLTSLSILLALPAPAQDMAKQPAIIDAIRTGDLPAVKMLLTHGANPNTRELLTTKPSASEGIAGGKVVNGDTALQIAVKLKSAPIAKLLLDFKADPNGRGAYGWTPLMSACQHRSFELANMLLAAGSKPNIRNTYGDTAINFAANENQVEIVRILIESGADVNGGTGQSALDSAIVSDSQDAVKLLLQRGANPNFHHPGSLTPLEFAEERDAPDMVALIRRAGGKGRSPAKLRKDLDVEIRGYRDPEEAKREARAVRNASFAKLLPDDPAVIQAVIVDMLELGRKEDVFGQEADAKNVYLIAESQVGDGRYTENQMNGELNEREANAVSLSMRLNLMRRNSRSVSFKACPFSDSRIVVKPGARVERSLLGYFSYGSKESPNREKAKGWVQVMLPGYSADGNRAVVSLSFGPTSHGASGTFLVERRADRWTVVWRHFAFYA